MLPKQFHKLGNDAQTITEEATELTAIKIGATTMPDSTMPFEVHAEVAKSFAKEYVEAVITDAIKILPSYKHRQDTLIVINQRRIAVILDKQARRGAVIPVEFIEQVIEGPMKAKLQTWLANPPAPFYVMHIGGSWFSEK